MKEKAFTLDRGKRYLFYILMIAILGWFLFMQFFGADERSQEMSSGPVIYSGTFIWQKSDGTSEKITVPGKYKVPAGETMVLISQLPDTLQETDIAIRSSLQDVNVYINNELRTSYSTRETRLAGKNSASRYIFCPVSSSDAGKQLRIIGVGPDHQDTEQKHHPGNVLPERLFLHGLSHLHPSLRIFPGPEKQTLQPLSSSYFAEFQPDCQGSFPPSVCQPNSLHSLHSSVFMIL